HAHRTELVAQGPLCELAGEHQPVSCLVQGGVTGHDPRAARAAVGDEHVYVDGDRLPPELLEVHRAAQGPPDQPLDLLRAAAAVQPLALATLRRAARQQRVLGREPAALVAAGAQVRGQLRLDRHGRQYPVLAPGDQGRALGVRYVADLDAHRPEFGRSPSRPSGSRSGGAHAASLAPGSRGRPLAGAKRCATALAERSTTRLAGARGPPSFPAVCMKTSTSPVTRYSTRVSRAAPSRLDWGR